jgi:hypothetical protein
MIHFNNNRQALTATRITEEKRPEIPRNTNFKLTSTISAASKPNNVSFRRNVGSGSIKDLILFYEATYGKNGSNEKCAKPSVTAPIVIQKQTNVTCQQVESKASLNINNNTNEVNSDASTFSSTNSSIASSLASSVASLANNDKTNISNREVSKRFCFADDDDDDESISQNENLEIIMSSKATQANINQYKHINNTSEIFSRPAFINNKRINSSSTKLLSEINTPAQKQNEDGELPMRVLNYNHENYVSSNMLNDNRGGGGEEERNFLVLLSKGMLKQIYKSLLFI